MPTTIEVFTANNQLSGTLYLHELLQRGGRYAPACVEVAGHRMTPSQAEARGGCANVRDWRFSLKTMHNGKIISLNHLLKVELRVEGPAVLVDAPKPVDLSALDVGAPLPLARPASGVADPSPPDHKPSAEMLREVRRARGQVSVSWGVGCSSEQPSLEGALSGSNPLEPSLCLGSCRLPPVSFQS